MFTLKRFFYFSTFCGFCAFYVTNDMNIGFTVLSFFGLIIGGWGYFKGFEWYKHKQLIENTPRSRIRSIAAGLVEVYGIIEPVKKKAVFKSPFTKSDCVWCKWVIEKRGDGLTGSNAWIKSNEGVLASYFYVRDKTGRVIVDAHDAEVDIKVDKEYVGYPRENQYTMGDFKDDNAGLYYQMGSNQSIRFREFYLAEGDKIYVLGKAGKTRLKEAVKTSESHSLMMIKKGYEGDPFYISDRPEKHILETIHSRLILSLYGGSALILLSLGVIFNYFGIL